MLRFATLLTLSLLTAAPALACGMAISPEHQARLADLMKQIDAADAPQQAVKPSAPAPTSGPTGDARHTETSPRLADMPSLKTLLTPPPISSALIGAVAAHPHTSAGRS